MLEAGVRFSVVSDIRVGVQAPLCVWQNDVVTSALMDKPASASVFDAEGHNGGSPNRSRFSKFMKRQVWLLREVAVDRHLQIIHAQSGNEERFSRGGVGDGTLSEGSTAGGRR